MKMKYKYVYKCSATNNVCEYGIERQRVGNWQTTPAEAACQNLYTVSFATRCGQKVRTVSG